MAPLAPLWRLKNGRQWLEIKRLKNKFKWKWTLDLRQASTWCLRAETKIIRLRPHKEFAHVKEISKNPGKTTELISRKAKKHMTQFNRWAKREAWKRRLNPCNSTLGQRAREKKMVRAFKVKATKTSLGDVITKGTKPLRAQFSNWDRSLACQEARTRGIAK